jgi:glutaredoxin-related protein
MRQAAGMEDVKFIKILVKKKCIEDVNRMSRWEDVTKIHVQDKCGGVS